MTDKNLAYYLALPYTIELIPDEDALVMLDDAKKLWLETALQIGKPIPEPELQLSDE